MLLVSNNTFRGAERGESPASDGCDGCAFGWLVRRICFATLAFPCILIFGAAFLQCGGLVLEPSSDGGNDRTDAAEAGVVGDATPDQTNMRHVGTEGGLAHVGQDVVAFPDVTEQDAPEQDASEQDVIEQDVVEQDVIEHDVVPGCVSGAPCEPAACAIGTTECSDAGTISCVATGTSANGSACDAGGTVCFNGSCVFCSPGAACAAANPCQQAIIVCSNGASVCTAQGNVPDGTPCGTSGICCGGTCGACTTVDTCSGTGCDATCNAGVFACGGSCVNSTNDNAACGATCRVCPAGSTCISFSCTIEYGDFTPFACNTVDGLFSANFLLGQSITIPQSITVTNLGVVGAATGGDAILALYTNVGGVPTALVAETTTAGTPLEAGSNQILVTSPVNVAPGSYWIMGEYDATVSLCVDNATSETDDFIAVTFGTVPSSFGTVGTDTRVQNINYYVVGVLP